MKTIAVIGALDTKSDDVAFVRDELERGGVRPFVVDFGIIGDAPFEADLAAAAVAEAGGTTLDALRQAGDRGVAVAAMAEGMAVVITRLFEDGHIDGVLGLGGSAGTAVATAAMRRLPLSFPKGMITTLAAGDTSAYVGSKDIVLFPSVVDVAGVNRISAPIYARAAGALVGMVETAVPDLPPKPLVAASMFGNTTQLVNRCQAILDDSGFEVLVFHATGTGGRTMESLIDEGVFVAALDVTTTELADELVGGVLSAGPERLSAAGRAGIPQVVAPGCLDMVNFWAPDTIPERFAGRRFYHWNPNVTLMRTTPEENAILGRQMAEKLNAATGPVTVLLPTNGFSVLDSPGGEFWWPEANAAFVDAFTAHANPTITIQMIEANINNEAFAQAVTGAFYQLQLASSNRQAASSN